MRAPMVGTILAIGVGVASLPPAHAEQTRVYCAQVREDDTVRPLPSPLVAQARRLFELTAEISDDGVRAETSVRCMGGAVWLCNVGANLSCGKANTRRDSPGASAFCRRNPNAIGVPMSATGHDAIYSWKCVGGVAQVEQQLVDVDARGFLAGNWKRLTP